MCNWYSICALVFLRGLVNALACLQVPGLNSLSTWLRCLSDASWPLGWHHAPRTCTDHWKRICLTPGPSPLSCKWQALQIVPQGMSVGGLLGPTPVASQWTCLSHVASPWLSCHNAAKNTPPPYATDTSFCCWNTNRWKFCSRQAENDWLHFLISQMNRYHCVFFTCILAHKFTCASVKLY